MAGSRAQLARGGAGLAAVHLGRNVQLRQKYQSHNPSALEPPAHFGFERSGRGIELCQLLRPPRDFQSLRDWGSPPPPLLSPWLFVALLRAKPILLLLFGALALARNIIFSCVF